MISILKTYLWLLLLVVGAGFFSKTQTPFKTISHKVIINHPGEETPVNTILKEIQNEEGLPVVYTMDVYSVICLEGVCKIIPVKLFWNNIGEYQKYELAEGQTLEKYEADPFEPKDYLKIQDIMANPNSPFKDVYFDEILTVPNEHGNEDVDAVSGATALELDEKDTVPGAALTCYTLWHWANGEVVSKIKSQTGKSASVQKLQDFILNENEAYFHIALRELQNRGAFSKPIIDVISNKVLEDYKLLRPTFEWIKTIPPELYLYATNRFFYEGEKNHKLAVLQSLRQVTFNIPKEYLDTLSQNLDKLNTYQEVSSLLNLLEAKTHYSSIVVNNVMPLLNADFLIARRAYWFLKECELSDIQEERLEAFYKNNQNRL